MLYIITKTTDVPYFQAKIVDWGMDGIYGINEESSSVASVESFEDCIMSSTNDEMCDLAMKFLVNVRGNRTDEMMQINGLEALCQITNDVLGDGRIQEESKAIKRF